MIFNEAKRYVRRYYVRPQNRFAGSKTDILKILAELGDQNCSIYTLNNLGDEKDVTKLTNKDIIYYYDEGILYDKNHVKVLDYDLSVKKEEKRDKINPESVSDEQFEDVYKDRITDQTLPESLSLDEAFMLDFDSFNAYGEKLVEGKVIQQTCCICGEEFTGYGNNPEPYKSIESGRCCNSCNIKFVIPARLDKLQEIQS